MSDTPRTEAVNQYLRTRRDYTKTDHEVWMNHGIQIEHELNAANAKIKRLEEAGDAMASAWDKEWLTDTDIEAIIDYWHGAKEAKP